jgi:succinate dehydrogenase / fumarate reductase, cytochrome b subunit
MMAEAKQNVRVRVLPPRPMSPHLSVYRFQVNMVLSIMHRITGVANYWGGFLLMTWLVSAAMGDAEYKLVSSFLGSPIGLVILVGFTWSVMHHMLGGIRHFIWDAGYGFSAPVVRALSWGTLFGSLTLTGIIWYAGLSMWGKH